MLRPSVSGDAWRKKPAIPSDLVLGQDWMDGDIASDRCRGTPPVPVAMGLDGPSAHMRRLPAKSRPGTSQSFGGWSAPALLCGMPGEIGQSPLWAPGKEGSARAKTAGEGDWRDRGSRGTLATFDQPTARKRKPIGLGKPNRNPAVWQRWQVSASGNKLVREEVLERDRERQRANYGIEQRRNFASPARSHAASLFFASVPGSGGEASEFLPPGAMRRVARPQTRQMNQLPNMATGSAVSSNAAASPAKQGDRTPANAGDRGHIPEDLQNEDLVFKKEEETELTELLENYAMLTAGADQASLGGTAVSQPATNAPGPQGLKGLKEQAVVDPYVLRPLFCRFLLASKMCGEPDSTYMYHESLAEFDKYATLLGAWYGIQRSVLILVIARMLRQKGDSGMTKKKDATGRRYAVQENPGLASQSHFSYDPVTGEQVDDAPRPPYIKQFFETTVPNALEHYAFRKLRAESREKCLRVVEPAVVPENVLAEVSSGNIWPPLPPRTVLEPQLPQYMQGVRKWQEELETQNPARLLAQRRYTETVLRGEVLGGQLLEPEVLHFATRFQPLFTHIFSAYADWPTPQLLIEAAECGEITQGDVEMHKLGHLSFSAFFRFCVDFQLMPEHASFEEIRQIYSDSEAVIPVPSMVEPDTPTYTDSQADTESTKKTRLSSADRDRKDGKATLKSGRESPSKKERPSSGASEKADTKQRPPSGSGRPPSASERPPSANGRPASASPKKDARPASGEKSPKKGEGGQRGTRGSIKTESDGGHSPHKGPAAHLMKSKKAQQAAAIAVAAAKAAAADAVPKANLEFMKKSFATMSDIELRTVTFFAGIDEWLAERFIRFADVWNDKGEEILETCDTPCLRPPSALRERRPTSPKPEDETSQNSETGGEGGFQSIMAEDEALETVPELPAEVLQLQNHIMSTAALPDKAGQRRNSNAERQAMAAAAACAQAAAAAAMAVPPVVTINAARLLEAVSLMGMANKPSEAELEAMFVQLLSDSSQRKDNRSDNSRGSVLHGRQSLGVDVFQMDKILRTARDHLTRSRKSCSIFLRTKSEMSASEQDVSRFLTDLNTALFQRASFMGIFEDFLADCGDSFPPQRLLDKAREFGVDTKQYEDENAPTASAKFAKFNALLLDHIAPNRNSQMLQKTQVYSALVIGQEGRRYQRREELRKQLLCLAHMDRSGPETTFFGLASFVECVLKLALHRLGGKGSNEIQRGSPAWWKCAWLIALLSREFKAQLVRDEHEKQMREFSASVEAPLEDKDDEQNAEQATEQVSFGKAHTERPRSNLRREQNGRDVAPSPREALRQQASLRPTLPSSSMKGRPSSGRSGSAMSGDRSGSSSPVSESRNQSPTQDRPRSGLSTSSQPGARRRYTAPSLDADSDISSITSPAAPKMSPQEKRALEVDAWWRRSCSDSLPRYMSPLEQLVREMPELFDPATGEAVVSGHDPSALPVPCSTCNEMPSPSGWGTPGCPSCSQVEELCLPISKHLFSSLLVTIPAEAKAPEPEDTFGEEEPPEASRPASPSKEKPSSNSSSRRSSMGDNASKRKSATNHS